MANLSDISVHITEAGGKTSDAKLQQRDWTPADGRGKALRWGGGVFLMGILILPIPIVHFGAVPIILLGVPLVSLTVYRVYRSGTDVLGRFTCPACNAEQEMQSSSPTWPLHRLCQACRASLSLTRP